MNYIFFALGIVVIILVVIIGLLSRKSFRAVIYRDMPILFRDGEDGEVFLIHVDDDLKYFQTLKDTLEGEDEIAKKHNKKYLRGRKYQTLYHERDFVAGELITQNIKNCVDRCRKALILLTPAFLNSQWSRDEFVIAQSQDKAIFIRLKLDKDQEDELNELLSKPENAPIKLNLETRTYLKWSGEMDDKEFWKWLAYLLPHKKPGSSRSDENGDIEKNPLMSKTSNGTLNDKNPLSNPPLRMQQKPENIELNIQEKSGTESTIIPDTIQPNSSYEDEDWYHPEFSSMRDAYLAMVNRTNMEGTYMITNIPEAERSYGLYEIDSYVILIGGATSRDVSSSVIRKDESKEGFLVTGADRTFSSLFELIHHFKHNPLPDSENVLVESLKRCSINENKRCRRCSSRDGN